MYTSYEVAEQVTGEIQRQFPDVTVCLVGGTTIDPNANIQGNKTFLTGESDKPTRRSEDGSIRDLDLVAITADPSAVRGIQTAAEHGAKSLMKVSVFGLERYFKESPVRGALGNWVSRRLIDKEGDIHHRLYPFQSQVPQSAFTHTLVFPDGHEAATFSPTYSALSYELRSIGGLRKRDAPKVRAQIEHLKELGLWLPKNPADDTEEQSQYRELHQIAQRVASLGKMSLRDANYSPTVARIKLAHWYDSQDWAVAAVHSGLEDVLKKVGLAR